MILNLPRYVAAQPIFFRFTYFINVSYLLCALIRIKIGHDDQLGEKAKKKEKKERHCDL